MMITELSHFGKLFKGWQSYKSCDLELANKYRNILPPIIINTWENLGFQKFAKGFLWSVDPDEYREIIAGFIYDYQVSDTHVLFRTGFGDLIFLYETKLFHLSATTLKHGQLSGTIEQVLEMHLGQREFANSIFFLKEFNAARASLGNIEADELFAPVPVIPLGGEFKVESMKKFNLKAHMSFLAKL
ncbi:MAG: DUF1851 domain-containing protein [Acidobacteria bacterium]|nr:DUF1851 domain-containing protein [Acidobacteriota bacterium]